MLTLTYTKQGIKNSTKVDQPVSTSVDDSNNNNISNNRNGIPAIGIASSSALYGSSSNSAAAALATLMICNDVDMRARPPRLMGPNGELSTPYNWEAAVSYHEVTHCLTITINVRGDRYQLPRRACADSGTAFGILLSNCVLLLVQLQVQHIDINCCHRA
jgi:hypothetical protein